MSAWVDQRQVEMRRPGQRTPEVPVYEDLIRPWMLNINALAPLHSGNMISVSQLLLVGCLGGISLALPSANPRNLLAVSNAKSSLTFLFQNNLNLTDDVNHVGAILLDPMPPSSAAAACAALGEQLLPKSTLQAHQSDFFHQLSYNAYAGRASPLQLYYIANGTVAVAENVGSLTFPIMPQDRLPLPVLCTQSSNQDNPETAVPTRSNLISLASTGNTYIGFRNQKSFRFQGIPYADPPQRFVYSTLYSAKGQTINATAYGSECSQGGAGSENCLFLNIQTPYIPKAGSNTHLRPVMFWVWFCFFIKNASGT